LSVGDNGRGYLAQYYDTGLVLPEILDRQIISNQEIERLTRAVSIVTITRTVPRRLGGDASQEELALDKKRSRRMLHALMQSLSSWGSRNQKFPLDDEIRLIGVHLNWETFKPAHLVTIQNRMTYVATYSIRMEDTKWGRSAVMRLENEYKWVSYALRD
jgi:hypothetical protein